MKRLNIFIAIAFVLIAGCRMVDPKGDLLTFQSPVVVTEAIVLERATDIEFRDATGESYLLLDDWYDDIEHGVLSLSTAGKHPVSKRLTSDDPAVDRLRRSLQAFVDSRVTPEKLRDISRRAGSVKTIDSVTEEEWKLLHTSSMIAGLKRLLANKAMEATQQNAP